ncbi:hypothetical protein C1645_360808 [Glomus cerebriforme]|uniref:Uncharacterized protein n=1 Tax=Glomus cerebriforme TaxID=658196 RepID=A0A397SHU7_9GLOM|nr:hypothetical protein C1645_360808 [Glomus cerebriforme]
MIDDLYPVDMFDLLLFDVRSKDLHDHVSKRLKVEYLSDTLYTELKDVNGIIFGPYLRIMVSLPIQIKRKRKNVHFVVDTGSPKTFVCEEVYEAFKMTISDSSVHNILLNNKPTVVYLPPINSHFIETNVLGTEYLKAVGANLTINFDNENVSISFENYETPIISQSKQNVEQMEPNNVLGGIIGSCLITLLLVFILKKNSSFFFLIAIILIAYSTFDYIKSMVLFN